VYFSTGLAQVHGRGALMDTFMLAVAIVVGAVVIGAVLIYFLGIADWMNRGSH
jgi:hypothetical protein